MRKNGFTLIELLAVIVILAIIALIATPIILGIINDAREKANERSVELYASAVRNGIAAYQLRTGNEVKADTYNESNPLPFEPNYDGNVKCTNITINEDGKLYLDACTVNDGEKTYNYGEKKEITFSDVCTPVRVATKGNVPQGNFDFGDEYICDVGDGQQRTFYVLEDGDNTTLTKGTLGQPHYPKDKIGTTAPGEVSLIMSTNLISNIYWISYDNFIDNGGTDEEWDDLEDGYPQGNNTKGPIDLVNQLKTTTSTWKVEVNIPTYGQMAAVMGSDYSETPSWLADNITEYGTEYWTSTSSENYFFVPYVVSSYGLSEAESVTSSLSLRPVITLKK